MKQHETSLVTDYYYKHDWEVKITDLLSLRLAPDGEIVGR